MAEARNGKTRRQKEPPARVIYFTSPDHLSSAF